MRGPARGGRIVSPMDDIDGPLQVDCTSRFPQEPNRLLAVEDIEQEATRLRTGRDAESRVENVPHFALNVLDTLLRGPFSSPLHHPRFDVERVDDSEDSLGQRYRERAVAAAQLNHVPVDVFDPQPVENEFDIKE